MIMILIISLIVLTMLFLLCITSITLSDTETFKVIDRKIADRLEKKERK